MPFPHLIPHEALVKSIADFFTSAELDPSYFDAIDKRLVTQEKPTDKNSSAFRRLGFLRSKDFIDYGAFGNNGLHLHLLEEILDVLVSVRLLKKGGVNMLIKGGDTLYNANSEAKYLLKNDLLMNRLFGFQYIIDQYLSAVFKIENWKNGSCDIGNGFFTSHSGVPIVVTNAHVIEGSDKVVLKDHSDKEISCKRIVPSDKTDLAILELDKTPSDAKPFHLNADLNVLTEILTIGYPPVPTTKGSYPLFHRGEVNSKVESYWGHNLFLFSAKTNPGNSGSPVIDGDGTVLGIVTQQLEEKQGYKKGMLPYYAAVPSNEILAFLNETLS